ncbi:MAG TPA: ABC transporter permease [Thioploca sp.]|nr:ABC transporter permease [Thioploca sp.]
MWVIASRELRSLFISPLAWSILGAIQIILGWFFAVLVEWFLQPEVQTNLASDPNASGLTSIVITSLFDWIAIIFLLATPLLTMRLISEERRNNTLPLLLSAPISMGNIILGKFLGLMAFFLIMLAMLMLMPLSLLLGGTLDFGQLLSGLLGLILFSGVLIAIGLYISTLTSHPTVAAISTFGTFLLLWMLDWGGNITEAQDDIFSLSYWSITNHYQSLLQGLFSTADVVFYLLMIGLFLMLSTYRLDAERIQ